MEIWTVGFDVYIKSEYSIICSVDLVDVTSVSVS
jgi:hypothetical protein